MASYHYVKETWRFWQPNYSKLDSLSLEIVSEIFTSDTECTLHKKMKFSIKNFSSKCEQIRRKLRIWSHLLEKSLMENFIFCAVVIIIWGSAMILK